MTTIKDVAKEAGVSVATVSRYMNKSGYIKKETGEKIEQAIQKFHYVPNEVARSLFQKKSKLVGLLIPDIENPFFPTLAKGAEDVFNQHGYTMLLGNATDSEEQNQEYLLTFAKNNIGGILSTEKKTENINVPFVSIDRFYNDDDYAVFCNNYEGGKLAAEEILKTNFHKITLVKGPKTLKGAVDRFEGISEVLTRENIPYEVMEISSYNGEKVKEYTERFFREYPQTDTVIASHDMLALTILQEAQTRGIKVPEELQIIGYDGILFSEMCYPKLVTIRQPVYEMGAESARQLIRLMKEEEIEEKQIILPVTLSEGATLRYL
ncbi:transcriptional regulator, LacI family [Pilibacter termitis]|uniref:Transcriptional regulator, LacI family n=1 Tax=Pilibacter termitis TaxID=263852 RepID=A0A1T4LWW2_9ENTE|nr:LacI family DNA-binding transcriptional regulator [Pilibacter termitis]SJZ59165.1 transcriptional regulator, LacI family [Pilibacter termitis]